MFDLRAEQQTAVSVARGNTLPCDGCTACCRSGIAVMLMEEDDPRLATRSQPHGLDPSLLELQHQPNGDCAWLENGRCAAYEFRPVMCRAFSCVGFWYGVDRHRRRDMLKQFGKNDEVYRAASKLFKSGVLPS